MTKRLLVSFCSVLALVVGLLLVPLKAHADPSALTITQQPEDVEVTYPDGTSFHVEVSDPDQVESYQWILSDGYSDFILDGVSATTDTLVIPSTQQDDPNPTFRCVITDKDGNTIESEPAVMRIANHEENKTVLYVGDYAVEPGETLDLSETTLGTGTVTFDTDGINVTLDNVRMSTETMTYDTQLSPALGIFIMRRQGESLEYHFNLVGDSVLYDTYYDPDYNAAGIVFNTYFAAGDNPNPPTIYIEGAGSLELKGGSNSIYSDSNIEINTALTTEPNGDIYCDAITCRSLLIDESAKLNIDTNGTALRAKGDIRIASGANIDIYSSAPHVSVGATAKSIVNADGSIYIDGATLFIRGYGDPERFVPYESMLANFVGISFGGDFNAAGSTISIEMTAGDAEEDWYMSCYGISGEGETSALALTDAATIMIAIDTPKTPFVGGITVPGILSMDAGCTVDVTVSSAGETLGVEADREITINDATLNSVVSSTEGLPTYGVVCGGITVSLSEAGRHLHSIATGGVALAADTGEHGEFDVTPHSGYTTQKIVLSGGASITTPKNGTVNLFGAPGYGETIKAETIYASADLTTPASEVEIALAGQNSQGSVGTGAIVGVCVCVAAVAAALVLFRRKKSA